MPRFSTAALPLALPLALAAAPSAQSTLHDHAGSAAEAYGQVCDVVGDTDADGRAETLVGAWRHDPAGVTDAGAVFVYDGATGALALTVPGTGIGDHMGFGSSAAGDVNDDGFADVCAAADEDDVTGAGSNAGSATIISGLDGTVIWTFTGDSASDLFGWSTAAAGDVDGDGVADVLIGALQDEGGGSPSNAGSISAYSGATGLLIHRIYGSVLNGSLGSKVGRAGDVDGDGRADLIAAQGSLARVFSGADASVLHDFSVPSGGTAGLAVSGGIDANNDGFADLVVGASGTSTNAGRVVVFSGATGAILWDKAGDLAGDLLGASVAGAGDLDADGHGDFVAGMPGSDGGGSSSGALRAFSGRDGSVLFTVSGNAANHRIGASAGAGADIDLDGFPDAIGSATSGNAKSVSFTPQGIEPFGTGTPGCDGPQPLLANGVPTLGDAGFALFSSNAPPLLPAFLALGDTGLPAGVPVLGALLHVAPPPAGGFLLLFTTPPADAGGTLIAPLPIPATPALLGATFAAQLGTAWAAGPCAGTFTSTTALTLTIQ
jgi:hypothetical protein